MSEKFEQSIVDWYGKAQTNTLEYLDLANNQNPRIADLGHNIGVIHNQVNLLSKVSLKHFYLLDEENRALRGSITQLQAYVCSLEKECVKHRSLTTKRG